MFKKFIAVLSLSVFCTVAAFAQAAVSPSPEVASIVREAAKQRENYRESFKNLIAVETKTSTKFDKSGAAGKSNVVESDFLVYQSSKDQNSIAELRNVTKVDGKTLPDSQKRSDELFAELKKTATKKKELERIQAEGSRYDKNFEISGVTISEAVTLAPKLQSAFDFTLDGTENIDNKQVYVVSYRQTKPNSLITLNSKNGGNNDEGVEFSLDLPGAFKKKDAFLRGKLYIDAQTYRIRREIREVFVQPENPLVLLTTIFEYQPSDYEIYVPKKIVMTFNNFKKKDKNYAAFKDFETAFDYSKFRKTETDVKILDDDK